jgi:protoheme IX farnesyltransferase
MSAPGPWLRLVAIGAVAGVAVVVATGEWALPHDVASHVTVSLLAGVAIAAWAAHREDRLLVGSAVGALAAFSAAGLSALVGVPGGLHLALGALALAAAGVATAATLRARNRLFPARRRPGAPSPWRDYLALTKPRIMSLLLLTGAGGLVLGARGVPSAALAAATLSGLALACGGASALNHVLDRDIDRLMGKRTKRRPVAAGRVAPARALEFGVALSALSFAVLASFVNVLAAALAIFGNLFYVLVYTRWLKRTTAQNIVIGGAAGAVPPVVGWAAATGDLALPALLLFLIVFFWTPPHFWALALLIRRDYAAAGIPMLPVVRGEPETARAIVRYTVLLVAISLLPVAARTVGLAYLAAALVLGAAFLALVVALQRRTTARRARRVFSFSLAYLALLFVALAVDPLLAA